MIEIFQHFIKPKNKGGFAVYGTHNHGDSFITVTTAYCSNDDQYSKQVACDILRRQYVSENTVRIPLPSNVSRRNPTHRDIRNTILDVFGSVRYF